MHPVIISQISTDEKFRYQPFTPLSKITEIIQTLKAQEIHRVRVQVVSVQTPESGSLKDCVRLFDAKKGQSTKATAKSAPSGKHQ